MHRAIALVLCAMVSGLGSSAWAETEAAPDPIAALVNRLDLERYKETIKGLTQFGDRRQGTDRNRAAIDWIEARLRSYGCSTERFAYQYPPPAGTPIPPRAAPASAEIAVGGAQTGRANPNRGERQSRGAAQSGAPAAEQPSLHIRYPGRSLLHEDRHGSAGRNVHRQRPYGRHRLGRSG